MISCPPSHTGDLIGSGYLPAKLNYYNLHGVADSPEWYGQTESNKVIDSPEYPVAMTPKDINNDGNAPAIVFSEACYGAHISNKTEDQAISLKFLAAGTQAFAGSTCIAYGSVAAPLIGADLMASHFWKAVKEGVSVGEALRNAKVIIAQDMTKQQGFLDGEDQKTLISFVLYGDPMIVLATGKKPENKSVKRDRVKSPVVTVCQSEMDRAKAVKVDAQVMAQVKQIVEQYLPGLKGAHFTVSKQYATQVTATFSKGKVSRPLETERTVVTVSKQYQTNHLHSHYARMTFDQRGKVVKLAVSR